MVDIRNKIDHSKDLVVNSIALANIERKITLFHAFVCKEIINKYSFNIDLIGFHGQTIAHDPENRRTHQIGSGDQVSSAVKLPTVWDFRTADVKNGGQGAPLTPFFHFACAKYLGIDEVVAFLNLGGVGNITIVDATFESPEINGALLAFDTGPANGPIDDLMFENLKKHYDLDGNLASRGKISKSLISEFLSDDYFSTEPPKSLDRNSFKHFQMLLRELPLDIIFSLFPLLSKKFKKAVSITVL